MTTFELPWMKLSLSNTTYFAQADKDESAYALQWHTAASSLFIMFPDQPEIDIRLDREVVDVHYQDPEAEDEMDHDVENEGTAFIRLLMLPSRPLPWATGTSFDPMSDQHNGICIQLVIDTEAQQRSYRVLVAWMKRNLNEGETTALSLAKAGLLWGKNQPKMWMPLEVSDDEPANDGQVDNNPVVLKTKYGQLRKDDIQRLKPAQYGVFDLHLDRWANDTLISFYLTYTARKVRKKDPDLKFHILRTNFYKSLVDHPDDLSEMKSKVNLLQQDFVLIPIHLGSHWFLVIIDHPGRSTKGTNKSDDGTAYKPGTYILDSFKHGHPQNVFHKIEGFLKEYAREKDVAIDIAKFRRYNVPVPTQNGPNECGFYLLHFAEQFMKNPEKFRDIIRSKQSTDLKETWGDPEDLRPTFGRLVDKLRKTQSSSPPA